MQSAESKEKILVQILNDHIDLMNSETEHDLSDEVAFLPPEEQTELHSLISIDRLLRMVASDDKAKGDSPFRLAGNVR